MKYIAALILLISTSYVATSQPIQPQPDRKDYLLSALQAQRNDAYDREALCKAESITVVEAMRKEIADLKEKLASADKK